MNKSMKDLDIENMNDYEDAEPTDKELKDLLREEHVKTEAEFKDKLLEDWDTLTCVACYKEVKITKAFLYEDAPYHKWCAEELGLI
jgi:hypothetical protein